MTEKNEVLNVNEQTGEILSGETVVQETDNYKVVQLEDGTFKKNMKYKKMYTRVPETEEEQIELYKVFNDENSTLVTTLSNMVGKEITINHFFTNPYQSFDEKTGIVTDGVTTTIEDVDGSYYVTSSKSVYYSIFNIMDAFGFPSDNDFKPIKVNVTGTKRQNGVQIDLELIGR